MGAHRIDQRIAAGNITSDAAESLGKRAFKHIDVVHDAITLGHARPASAVHPDGVHLIGIGQRSVLFREIADAMHRSNVAVHGVDGFEHDQLRAMTACLLQQAFEMPDVVVAPDQLLAARSAHAFDN